MRSIKNKSVIIFIFLFMAKLSLAQISLPQDNFVEGWLKSAKERSFSKEALFNYIDGGAEIFLEYGFKNLIVQDYKKGTAELTLNIYQMENADAALGIYLKKCGRETPRTEIKARNSFDRFQLSLVKNNFFIQIDNFRGKEEFSPAMISLAASILAQIPKGKPSTLLSILPQKNLLAGSQMIIRGPYALQPLYTFGKGDVLLLKGRVFAVAGDYADEQGTVFTRLIIQYPDSERAEEAYQNLLANLDSYIKIIERKKNKFSFVDYKKKFGIAEINGNIMEIRINLISKPGDSG